jgi:hypothetical protein
LLAHLNPENLNDDILDPFVERPWGWRIVIERPDVPGDAGIVRSTWEPTLAEALAHMELYWPGTPTWRDSDSGEVVNLTPGRT